MGPDSHLLEFPFARERTVPTLLHYQQIGGHEAKISLLHDIVSDHIFKILVLKFSSFEMTDFLLISIACLFARFVDAE